MPNFGSGSTPIGMWHQYGRVPQKTNDFSINWEIPIWLNENTNCKIIHPATDCEHDSSDYGISKRKGSDYIKDGIELCT